MKQIMDILDNRVNLMIRTPRRNIEFILDATIASDLWSRIFPYQVLESQIKRDFKLDPVEQRQEWFAERYK